MRSSNILFLNLLTLALAHGDHGGGGSAQTLVVDPDANWMTKHMAEEHHIADFDAASFFSLHDYDDDGRWEPEEILRTYGLMDESNSHVSQDRRDEIIREVLKLVDTDGDSIVSLDEFVDFVRAGKTLPDLGTGPGHHGDDEYEYEIHHWEKYHNEDTKLEDLTHPEDIEHFRKHEQIEEEEERRETMARRPIIDENIPSKFRRYR
ncbi:hypothetical protein VTK73DRAFT_112 [Phialemonium thermophilum]|uniref:EF-hand domain-containing protein n=1 Tax=Phialemonium thermophilum TaxID=223376 RepID=A0ABR3Y3Z9_9PEZI